MSLTLASKSRPADRYGATRGVVIDHDRTLMGITTLRDMVVRYAHVEEDET